MATVRKAQKRVYLLRANFSKNTPAGTTLQMLVSKAVAQLPKVSGQPDLNETARDSANHGKLRINQHKVNGSTVELKVVALAPGENATTVPISLQPNADAEGAAKPPTATAFKGGDFFILLHGNNVLCVGDHLRIGAVESYLREFFAHILPSEPSAVAFEVQPVARKKKAKMLEREGIKAIELNSTLYAATLDEPTGASTLFAPFRGAIGGVYESIKAVVKEDETEEFNEHLADVQVRLTIRIKGGLRGPGASRAAIDALGGKLVSNGELAEDEDISPVLVTNKGNRVSISEASVSEVFPINRRERENSLNDVDVWAILRTYHGTLKSEGVLDE
jgi:hypothetical protein